MIGNFIFIKNCFVKIRIVFGECGKERPIRNQKFDYKKVSYDLIK